MTKRRTFPEKTYTDLKEYQRDWLTAFRQAGHRPVKEDGHVDIFAYTSGDHHNGPRCTECGEGRCWHCTPPWQIAEQKCGGKAHRRAQEKKREDAVLAEAAEIRRKRRSAA